jgi:protein phosphatase 2C family protein 2/3
MMDKEGDRMRKRKNELIAAIQSVRQHLVEADEALQTQVHVNESVQKQRMLLDLQLQQLLKEYAQAQERIEHRHDEKVAKKTGVEKPAKMREVTVGGLKMTAAAASWQGNKEMQEDRYIIDIDIKSPDGHKIAGFAVLDGHSGSMCVDHVVENLGANIQQCLSLKPKLSEETLIQAVNEACILTDDTFLKKAREVEVLDGSTMILALIYPDDARAGENGIKAPGSCRLIVANIGDSRAVLCTARKLPGSTGGLMALPLSVDHKPNREDETARIEAKGGVVDFQGVWRVFTPGSASFGGQTIARWGLAVSRAFGDLLLKEPEKYDCVGVAPGGLVTAVPEIQAMDVNPQEDRFLVLACDGVWDVLTSEEAVSVCAEQETAKKAADAILRQTYASNSDDNLTAVVVTWTEVD